MVRWGLRALLLALVLVVIGWLSNASVAFEIIRVSAGVLLGVGFALLIVGYVRTPQPPEG